MALSSPHHRERKGKGREGSFVDSGMLDDDNGGDGGRDDFAADSITLSLFYSCCLPLSHFFSSLFSL